MGGDAADTTRRYREALRAGEIENAVGLLDEEVELVLPRAHYAGRRQVCDYLVRQVPLDHLEVESVDEHVEGLDGHAVATTTQVWRWREDGAEAYRRRSRATFTVRDGRILRIHVEHVA